MTSMNGKFFLDTNILVYAYDQGEPNRQQIAQRLLLDGIKSDSAVISTQVLGEFFVTMTHKIEKKLSPKIAQKEIELLRVLSLVEIDYEMVVKAIEIHSESQISYWDALIITAAKRAKCSVLYTEDLNDGQEINGVRIVNPFSQ